jgi:ATP-GRASP peptide maturase of grasp-with-spasm system
MILILSAAYERTTCEVITWLLYYKQPFLRINETSTVSINIALDSKGKERITVNHNNKKYNVDEFNCYWYRRGFFNYAPEQFNSSSKTAVYFEKYLVREYAVIQAHANFYLHKKQNIGSFLDNQLNKMDVLVLASRFGLDIPATIITGEKSEALEFARHHNSMITKGISEGFSMEIENYNFYLHTILIEQKDIQLLPEKFLPVLLQENLDKKYELRIFYLDGQCYSSVIFSQNDPKTKIDFRNYNQERPNRVCPYKLPVEVAKRINRLMKHLKMRTGSIDVVITKKNRYVFLEINPIGQFKQVSAPCNYFLEKIVAKKLMANER